MPCHSMAIPPPAESTADWTRRTPACSYAYSAVCLGGVRLVPFIVGALEEWRSSVLDEIVRKDFKRAGSGVGVPHRELGQQSARSC
jgi:hypothetical protein